MWAGTLHGGVHMWLNDLGLGALVPWTLHHRHADHESLRPAADMPAIAYPKYDGAITYDKLSSVFLSNTNHVEDQPVHLQLRDPTIPVDVNLQIYDGPEVRYCPAGVYEFVATDRRPRRRQIPHQSHREPREPGSKPRAHATAADQRAELRALQDLRHQGSEAEHPLGHAGRRRRSELQRHVTTAIPSRALTRYGARRAKKSGPEGPPGRVPRVSAVRLRSAARHPR